MKTVNLIILLIVSVVFPLDSQSAPLTGVVQQFQDSISNSAAAKSVSVGCGTGQSVIGVSGIIYGGNGKVILDEMTINDDFTRAKVSGKETDNYTSDWSVRAIAICADTPAGMEKQVLPSILTDSTSPKDAAAGCSAGKTMLGMGADIVGGKGEVGIYKMAPVVDAAGQPILVEVSAAEHDGFSGDWYVNAYAICADSDIDGQQALSADTSPTSIDKGITVYCPYGSVATATGFNIQNAQAGGIEEVIISSVDPGGSATTPTDKNALYAYEEDGTSLVWTLTTHVLCAQGS